MHILAIPQLQKCRAYRPFGRRRGRPLRWSFVKRTGPRFDYRCPQCGHRWNDWDEPGSGPLTCTRCGTVYPLEVPGLPVPREQAGKKVGHYSYCPRCEQVTLNVPGTTYCDRPLDDPANAHLGKAERLYHPDYARLYQEYQEVHAPAGNTAFYDQQIQSLPPVAPTQDQLAARFFACATCGAEKFWAWDYCCPVCDCDRHAVIRTTPPVYNDYKAMEFGGHPVDWDERWKCCLCGEEYWIRNSNC